jgi:hypothetical protein
VITHGSEPIAVIVSLEGRDDGGLRVSGRNLRGLHLSGRDPAAVWAMIPDAISTLLRRNHGVRVVSVRASKSPDDLFADLPRDVTLLVERERIFIAEVEAMAA